MRPLIWRFFSIADCAEQLQANDDFGTAVARPTINVIDCKFLDVCHWEGSFLGALARDMNISEIEIDVFPLEFHFKTFGALRVAALYDFTIRKLPRPALVELSASAIKRDARSETI